MAETKEKGDIGEAMVMADVLRRGYKVAIPVGEDWRYDLIVLRNGKLERVQCKYTKSDLRIVSVKCRSTNNWSTHKYTSEDLDWIATYDDTTKRVYYIPSSMLSSGRSEIKLRLSPPRNKQQRGINLATDFVDW